MSAEIAGSNFPQSTMLRPYKSRDALRRHRELEFAIATSYQHGSRARCRIGGNQDDRPIILIAKCYVVEARVRFIRLDALRTLVYESAGVRDYIVVVVASYLPGVRVDREESTTVAATSQMRPG
jgi:hypothetical protein